jgi:hypothetical protein
MGSQYCNPRVLASSSEQTWCLLLLQLPCLLVLLLLLVLSLLLLLLPEP